MKYRYTHRIGLDGAPQAGSRRANDDGFCHRLANLQRLARKQSPLCAWTLNTGLGHTWPLPDQGYGGAGRTIRTRGTSFRPLLMP